MSARKNEEDNNQLWLISYPGMEIRQITEELTHYLDLSIASSVEKAVATQATLISDIWVGSGPDPRNLKRITQAIGEFCWTPNGRLVYSSTATGDRNIWIMQPGGEDQRQLTAGHAVDRTPAVTTDNRFILFISNRTGSPQVWRMNLDGSNQVQLTEGAGKECPATSPDGKWVYFNTADDWHLWKVSIDGGDPVRVTDYFASWPSVSPDGKMIACVARTVTKRELLIVSPEGGQPFKRFDFNGWSSRLLWTDDAKALTYAGERDGVRKLMKQLLDGGEAKEITSFAEDSLFDFGYSFDGQLFAATRGSWQHDIVLISDLNRK